MWYVTDTSSFLSFVAGCVWSMDITHVVIPRQTTVYPVHAGPEQISVNLVSIATTVESAYNVNRVYAIDENMWRSASFPSILEYFQSSQFLFIEHHHDTMIGFIVRANDVLAKNENYYYNLPRYSKINHLYHDLSDLKD